MVLDLAAIGLLVTCSGWLVGVLEESRKRIHNVEAQVERNNGRLELLEVDLCAKLNLVLFQLESLEKRINDRN